VPNATYENFHQGQWRAALSERSLTSYGLAFGLIVPANVGVARVMRRATAMYLFSLSLPLMAGAWRITSGATTQCRCEPEMRFTYQRVSNGIE